MLKFKWRLDPNVTIPPSLSRLLARCLSSPTLEPRRGSWIFVLRGFGFWVQDPVFLSPGDLYRPELLVVRQAEFWAHGWGTILRGAPQMLVSAL